MEPITIELFDLAENDRGELLLALPDTNVDVDEAHYTMDEDDLILTFTNARTITLPNIPKSAQTSLHAGKEVLVVEATETELVRSYYAKASAPAMPTKRRGRL